MDHPKSIHIIIKGQASGLKHASEPAIKNLVKSHFTKLHNDIAVVEYIPNKSTSFTIQAISISDYYTTDVFSTWLPAEISNISLSKTRFSVKELPNKNFIYIEINGTVDSIDTATNLREKALSIQNDITIALSIPSSRKHDFLSHMPSQEKKPLQRLLLTQFLRHQKTPHPDLLEGLHRLILATGSTFRDIRSSHHFLRIARAHYWLKQQQAMHPTNELEKQLFFKIFPAKLSFLFGEKNVVSLVISLRSLSTYERFDHRHIVTACQRCLPSLEMIPQSFYVYQYPQEPFISLYIELCKNDSSPPSQQEWSKLKQDLGRELIYSIEQVVTKIDIPQNEEDLLRNFLLLSQQIRGPKDLPQVIIQLYGQTDKALDFHVTLVRAVQKGQEDLPNQTSQYQEITRSVPLRVSTIEKLRNTHEKQGLLLLVQCEKEPFLRRDRSVDFLKIRESVLKYIESLFGKVRDLNGGLIYQQHQLLENIKPLLTQEEMPDLSIIEDLFHSITPSIMKNLLGPEHILTVFRQFLSLRNESKERAIFDIQEYAKESFIAFEYPKLFTKEEVLQSKTKFQIAENELAVCVAFSEGRQFCFIVCRNTNSKTRKALIAWLKEKIVQKKRSIYQTLKISLPRPTLLLDPRIGTDRTSGTVIKMLYEGLMRLDQGGNATHAIAEEVIVSNNAKTYTFKLRESFWSNGQPLTAYDFEYAWKKVLDPSFKTIFDYLLHPILNARLVKSGRLPMDTLGIRAISDHVLVVELERPTPHFLELCCLWIYSPLCKEIDTTHPGWAYYGDRTYVCNGPFKLTKWCRKTGIQVLKNEFYWDKAQVNLEQIDISIIEDPLQALHLFEQGNLDWIGEPLSETPMYLIKQKNPLLHSQPMSAVQWYELNVQIPPFQSAKVRQAFSLAIDRKKVVSNCLFGDEKPSHSILPASYSLLDDKNPLPYDLEHAKELFRLGLEEQGLTPSQLQPIAITLYDQEPHKTMAQSIAHFWEKAFGISISLNILRWHEYFEKISYSAPEIWACVWYSWFQDPLYSFEILKEKTSPMNISKWSNKDFTQLVACAESEQEKHRRDFFLKKAEEIVMKEMPIVPVFEYCSHYMKNEAVQNIYISHLGNVDFKWTYFKEEQTLLEETAASSSKPKNELSFYLQSEPISLDPRSGEDRRAQQILRELFEGLTRIGRDGKPVLALAKSVNISKDGLTYTFCLKSALWSNGTAITAEDFAWTWKSILHPHFQTMCAFSFFSIKNAQKARSGLCSIDEVGIQALDDKTLQIILEYQVPYFLELLAHPVFSPICKNSIKKDAKWTSKIYPEYVCNGPFILKEKRSNSHIVLEKNPHYLDAEQVKNNRIRFKIIDDPQMAYNMFKSGELDWYGNPFGNMTPEIASELIQKKQLLKQDTGSVFWMLSRVQLPHLASSKIRKAIAYSINRQEICASLSPYEEIPAYSVLPNSLSLLDKKPFEDIRSGQAQELFSEGLKEIGYTKSTYPPIVISSWSDPLTMVVVKKMQMQIQTTLGIRVETAFQDWKTYTKKLTSGDFQFITASWFTWFPDTLHNLLYLKDQTNSINTTGWNSAKFATLLDTAIQCTETQQQKKLLKTAEKLLMDDMPVIPIISQTYQYTKPANLIGESISAIGTMELKWLEKKEFSQNESSPATTKASPISNQETIQLYLQHNPLALDPRKGGDRRSLTVLRNIYEGLTRIGSTGKPELALAEAISIANDGKTYTFRLRHSQWSNGTELTAHDFVESWKSILDPEFSTLFAYPLYIIKNARKIKDNQLPLDKIGVQALNTQTVQVHLEHPASYFLELLSLPVFSPVYTHSADYISNGPFVIKKYEHNSHILLEKNPTYWDSHNVPAKNISFAILKDPHTAYNLFQKGALDWYGHPFGEVPPQIADELEYGKELYKKETSAMFWLTCWSQEPHLQNAKIRQALARTINRQEICSSFLFNGEIPSYTILPSFLSLLDKQPFSESSSEEVISLFEEGCQELGLTRQTYPPLTITFWADPNIRVIAEIISLQLQHILQIDVQSQQLDWNTYFSTIKAGNYQLALGFWFSWYSDPMYTLEYLKYNNNGINDTGWENASYIQLLNLANAETNKTERLAILKKAEEFLIEEMPVIPLFTQTHKFAKSSSLCGEVISPTGHLEMKQMHKISQQTRGICEHVEKISIPPSFRH